MVVRVGGAAEGRAGGGGALDPAPAWKAFAAAQELTDRVVGYVSQPAHAALAGRLAAGLTPELFGELPEVVVETVGGHDVGWARPDLAALECAGAVAPRSFVAYPAQRAVEAWRGSVRAAECRGVLAGVLTSRHFCLLAPRDGDPAHEQFVREETARRAEAEAGCGYLGGELDRYTAALGFCDLLSLCLCCGIEGDFTLPRAHPADAAAAKEAEQVRFTVGEASVGFDREVLSPGTSLFADGWMRCDKGAITSRRWAWSVTEGGS